MAHSTPCDQCSQTGLPILFTRYAAAYSATPEGLAELDKLRPSGNLQTQPAGVAIRTARYNLRMLRQGYLYLRTDTKGLAPEWDAYAVHPHGYLTRIDDLHNASKASAEPACRPNEWGANRSLVWIKNVENINALHYMFHPDPIEFDHLMAVIDKAPEQFMQRFDVAAWAKGNIGQKDTCQPGLLNGQVMEFAAHSADAMQTVGNEQYFGLMGRNGSEREWGNFEEQRKGRHFEPVRHETRQADGSVIITDTGRTGAMSTGIYTAVVTQLPYEQVHGPRLKQLAAYLQEQKGAVVACEDAIGIAQELSLHHLTAAIPYVRWLHKTDDKGVSNHWRQSVSANITTIEKALSKKLVQTYDDDTDAMRRVRSSMEASYPGSDNTQPIKVRRTDGTYEEISVQELNRRRLGELDDAISARESDRSVLGVKGSNAQAELKIDAFCDRDAIKAFNATHFDQITQRDALMNKIAIDLMLWLKDDGFLIKALGRYSEESPLASGDGLRCAGQVKLILEQMTCTPKGREWFGSSDLFTPAKKNLVWRVLSLNNKDVSSELQAALETLQLAATPGESEVRHAEGSAAEQKSWADMAAFFKKISKTLAGADKIIKEGGLILGDPRKAGTGGAADSAVQLGKAVYDGPLGILTIALLAWLKKLPPAQWEIGIAKAQAMTLSYGLGREAAAYVQAQQALGSQLATKGIGSKALSATAFDKELRAKLPKLVASEAGALRLNHVQFALSGLAMLPMLGNLRNRTEGERATVEIAGAFAGLVGSLRQLQADRYEKYVFGNVPKILTKTQQAAAATPNAENLLQLKAGAAQYVAAGAVVGVAFDLFDARKAFLEQEQALGVAYVARAIVGGGTISLTLYAARFTNTVLWVTRTNLVLAILTIAATETIAALKGDAWANWLQAGPFRKGGHKVLHKSESESISRLAEALSEMS